MHAVYMEDRDYHGLINSLLDTAIGTLLGEGIRDQLMLALGEKAGIWPASLLDEDEHD